MNPLRIIILSFLTYLLFRLLIGAGRRPGGRAREAGVGDGGPVPDKLMEDPVCHTLIPAKSAITMNKDGKKIYFCSHNCRDQYNTNQTGEQR